MTPASERQSTLTAIDEETLSLVRIAAAIAGSDESTTRTVMEAAVSRADHAKVDEVILQSYLFAGFPRTLNAARIWRAVSDSKPPADDQDADLSQSASWTSRGEDTCKVIYGESYEMLRRNIRGLHPALDTWMITDGYGKVLSRPGLDLKTRELCIVAACAASGQQRQLHSHLHGALNAGATLNEVEAALSALSSLVQQADLERYEALLSRVASRRHPPRIQSS
ncbi:MAG TPA: carboxymuconolactone decarboxylase family protein [Gemmatimonadaceae bacterium]|jgi:4-carboxymuconolactone decarboxylase|nr:carboxymuconolactone decarboxylase family protein [Gemmatimonadaceae bacterium]